MKGRMIRLPRELLCGRGGMDQVHAEACSDLVSQPGPPLGLAAEASGTDERSGRPGLAARVGVAPPVRPCGVGGEVGPSLCDNGRSRYHTDFGRGPAFARQSVLQPSPGLQAICGRSVSTWSGDGGFSDVFPPLPSGSALARAPGGEVGVVVPSSPPRRKRKGKGHAGSGPQAA